MRVRSVLVKRGYHVDRAGESWSGIITGEEVYQLWEAITGEQVCIFVFERLLFLFVSFSCQKNLRCGVHPNK